MYRPSKEQIKAWLAAPGPVADLAEEVRQSPTTARLLNSIRREIPERDAIPALTYTLYRQFEHTGVRRHYEEPYFLKRATLTRAVMEFITGDETALEAIRTWPGASAETTWVLPAHEEQGPDYWELDPPRPGRRRWARTPCSRASRTRSTCSPPRRWRGPGRDGGPGGRRAGARSPAAHPAEVERHIFRPYLAYARDHWWFRAR